MADHMKQRAIHTLAYGESGSGKSSFARTFPKPMLVCSFDPMSKEMPYLEVGGRVVDGEGYTEVYSKNNPENVIIRIEYFHDPSDDKLMRTSSAHDKFYKRIANIPNEGWATVVIDSATFMEIAFRHYDQTVSNVGAKDRRQYYGASTSELENILMIKTVGWPFNVVVLAHTDFDKEVGDSGVLRYRPKMPGQKTLRDIGAAFTEVYHTYVDDKDNNEREYLLQTQSSRLFQAASRIHAPNPSLPHYKALWTGETSQFASSSASPEEGEHAAGDK